MSKRLAAFILAVLLTILPAAVSVFADTGSSENQGESGELGYVSETGESESVSETSSDHESESGQETDKETAADSESESESASAESESETQSDTETQSETESETETQKETLPSYSSSVTARNKITYELHDGITVHTAEKVFPKNTVLEGMKIDSGANYERASEALAEIADTESMAVYDINATLGYVVVQPKYMVLVSITVPENLDINDISFYYIPFRGDAEKIDITVDQKERTVSAELEHFSTYVLCNSKPETESESETEDITLNDGSMNDKSNLIAAVIFAVVGVCFALIVFLFILNNRKKTLKRKK